MDNIRIAVLSAYDDVCAFLDNNATDAMHYYDDKLVQYLTGATNTYTFTTNAKHPESVYLTEGNKLSFVYRGKGHYFNIMSVTRDEYEVEVKAYSTNFELLNEQKDAYKAPKAMTFLEYINVFDFEKVLNININEVSDKSITNEWTGTETMLARIYSLATVFDAEIEFIPELNDDYSLKRIVLNVYRKNSSTDQGIGRDRTDITLRYGVNVSGITKTSTITDLYTAIRPVGKDGLMVYDLDKKEYDASGKIEFQSPKGDGCIRAVQARDRFPSNVLGSSDRYISVGWTYDTDNVEVLYGQALAELKKNCVPQVEYQVDGYFDTDIGDTVTIDDCEFNPVLYLQARVTQQERSFTDPTQNKTTFSNFKELQSDIDPFLLKKMNDMIAANKEYSCSVLTDNGVVFKNGEGSTTLTASIMDVGKDMAGSVTVKWYKDGVLILTGKSITIKATDIKGKSVYRFEAVDSAGTLRGSSEVTVTNVDDGKKGDEGNTYYTWVKYATSSSGENLSDSPDGKTYMGLAYNKPTATGSTVATDYTWSLIKGDKGDAGEPTGVTESETAPETKYTGMLWKHTGTVAGLIKNATYMWDGTGWSLYFFAAANIDVDDLFAQNITATGTISGANLKGTKAEMDNILVKDSISFYSSNYGTISTNELITFSRDTGFAPGNYDDFYLLSLGNPETNICKKPSGGYVKNAGSFVYKELYIGDAEPDSFGALPVRKTIEGIVNGKGFIGNDYDLDLVIEEGTYWCDLSNVRNMPFGGFGWLEVRNAAVGCLLQRITEYNGNNPFRTAVRYYINSQWHQWQIYPETPEYNIITNLMLINSAGDFRFKYMQDGMVATGNAATLTNSPITSGPFYAYRTVKAVEIRNSNNVQTGNFLTMVTLDEIYPTRGRHWYATYDGGTKQWAAWISKS